VFDIAFSEIVVIAVVALVVIGPERLPKVARTLGHMFGRLQRYVNEVKADINREMELDELRKLQSEVKSAARDFESSMTNAANEVQSGVRSIETQLNQAGTPSAATGGAVPEAAVGAGAPTDQLAVVSTTATPSPSPVPAASGEPPRQAALPGFDRI
jgi:sec-independent protein translocase protein TatB